MAYLSPPHRLARAFTPLILSLSWALVSPTYAHSLDTAFFDLERTATGTRLIVALQPAQAFEVVRKPDDHEIALERFRERGDVLAAFVADHVNISEDGRVCSWDAVPGQVPATLFEAAADGITVTGVVGCSDPWRPFKLTSDLFIDQYPSQHNIIRIASFDGYREIAAITSSTRSVLIEPRVLWPEPTRAQPSSSASRILGLAALLTAVISGLLLYVWRERWFDLGRTSKQS